MFQPSSTRSSRNLPRIKYDTHPLLSIPPLKEPPSKSKPKSVRKKRNRPENDSIHLDRNNTVESQTETNQNLEFQSKSSPSSQSSSCSVSPTTFVTKSRSHSQKKNVETASISHRPQLIVNSHSLRQQQLRRFFYHHSINSKQPLSSIQKLDTIDDSLFKSQLFSFISEDTDCITIDFD